jgi:hypothetical protein
VKRVTGARTTDHDRLQGSWRQLASSVDGGAELAAPAGDEFGGALVTVFAGDTFRVLDAAGEIVRACDRLDRFDGRRRRPRAARALRADRDDVRVRRR